VNGNTGRITLPAPLREFAELELNSEVVVVGNFETVEIWSTEKYAEQKALGEEVYLADEEDDPDEE
jgi:DNA-binding transcriptional regulator/RsmH inhibitor MraZ